MPELNGLFQKIGYVHLSFLHDQERADGWKLESCMTSKMRRMGFSEAP
jgi:hypothetical protein